MQRLVLTDISDIHEAELSPVTKAFFYIETSKHLKTIILLKCSILIHSFWTRWAAPSSVTQARKTVLSGSRRWFCLRIHVLGHNLRSGLRRCNVRPPSSSTKPLQHTSLHTTTAPLVSTVVIEVVAENL